MEMKSQVLIWILLVGSLSACQRQKATIFVDHTWNRYHAKNACDMYKRNYEAACFKTPEQIATELKLRLASAFLHNRACKNVVIRYEFVDEQDMKDYLDGWRLTLNAEIDGRVIDYSHSVWSMFDNKTKKRFDGPLADSAEAATEICMVATGRSNSVSQ